MDQRPSRLGHHTMSCSFLPTDSLQSTWRLTPTNDRSHHSSPLRNAYYKCKTLQSTATIPKNQRSRIHPRPLRLASPQIRFVLQKEKSPHNFHATIVSALENWVRDQAPLESTRASPAVHQLIHSQRQIGWTRFLRGFLSKQWQDYLEYEPSVTLKFTGEPMANP
jgi:hypothetical protein